MSNTTAVYYQEENVYMPETKSKYLYVVVNHNNGRRCITDDRDQADALQEYWDVYGEGEEAVSVYKISKAEHARHRAVDRLTYVIESMQLHAMNDADLPF